MSLTPFPRYCWIGCFLLLSACSDDAALRRWGKAWEALPESSYPVRVDSPIPTAAAFQKEMEQYRILAEKLDRISPSRLNKSNRQLWSRYAAAMKKALESREQLQSDPAAFDLTTQLAELLGESDAPVEKRLQGVERCLENAPAYFETAKQLLRRPNPERTLQAIEIQTNTLKLLRESLPKLLTAAAADEVVRQRVLEKAYRAKLAVKDYLAFCESLRFEHSDTTLVRSLMAR